MTVVLVVPLLALAAVDGSVPDAGGAPADGGPARVDGGTWDGGFSAAVPASWTLSAKLASGSPARAALVKDLTAKGGGVGETPLSAEEAQALLDDPRAQLVYGDKTVSIVAPSMVSRHRQEHLDLMALFLKPERVEAGRAFVKAHAAKLEEVEKKTGVDRNVIVGILMWESKLGTITGDYRAFNVFTSQAFFIDEASAVALSKADEKKKASPAAQARRVESIRNRARANLLALLRQCKTRGIDALEVKGSWAGALGFPQFMPASLRWADDGNGDGQIDLFDMDDSIASIGRYLQAHGFKDDRTKAVWGYNHEDAYVQGVLAFADALKPAPDAGSAGR
ncbi:MAG: lytic murein transglycosylase [Myxococcaceae bacterium]|nr:lytic murein transglycosylase [Myxococcaceae bacterium]